MPRRGNLNLERLERREMLATFGTPWPQPQRLTLSFAPDGTPIGLYSSDLFATLGAGRSKIAWQTDILRAFQSWAAVANINIGLVADSGRPFGVAGLAQGDPRFGDIRLAAFPQVRAFANVVPYQAVAGSWSGDVFLNSAAHIGLKSADIDLYSVMLNEAGNAFGLPDNDDAASVMYSDYHGERDGLSPQDITAIQTMYGRRRPDAFEGASGNNSPGSAANIVAGANADSKVTIDGDVASPDDVDYFRVPVSASSGRVTIRLVASGRSLFVGRLDVLREDGSEIAYGAASSPLSNNVDVSFNAVQSSGSVLVRVAAAADNVFGSGQYQLEISSRGSNSDVVAASPEPGPATTPNAASAPDSPSPVGSIGFLDDEVDQNESQGSATSLSTPFGYVAATHYEAIGTIRTSSDVDVYRVITPTNYARTMLIHVDTFDVHPLSFHLVVADASGHVLADQIIDRADGRTPIAVDHLAPNGEYFVSMSAVRAGNASVGNYVLIIDLAHDAPQLSPLGAGTLTSSAPSDQLLWFSTRTELFRFDLRAFATSSASTTVRLTITDDRGTRYEMSTVPAATSTQYVWLSAGSYTFTISASDAIAAEFPSVSYELLAAALSDDTGPGLIDPTESLLPGDADGSGTVDRGDMAVLASQFGKFVEALRADGDFDGDGDVDLGDLVILGANFGRSLLPTSTSSTSSAPTDGGSIPPSASPSSLLVAASTLRTDFQRASISVSRRESDVIQRRRLSTEPASILLASSAIRRAHRLALAAVDAIWAETNRSNGLLADHQDSQLRRIACR